MQQYDLFKASDYSPRQAPARPLNPMPLPHRAGSGQKAAAEGTSAPEAHAARQPAPPPPPGAHWAHCGECGRARLVGRRLPPWQGFVCGHRAALLPGRTCSDADDVVADWCGPRAWQYVAKRDWPECAGFAAGAFEAAHLL